MKLLISFPAFQLQVCVRDSHTTSVGGDCPSTLRFPAGPQAGREEWLHEGVWEWGGERLERGLIG